MKELHSIECSHNQRLTAARGLIGQAKIKSKLLQSSVGRIHSLNACLTQLDSLEFGGHCGLSKRYM